MREPTVLVVDDDAQIRTFVARQMKNEHFNVELARTGDEALEKAAEVLPDIVILDLTMPVMDGIEALKRLREWATMPVIVLSARNEEQLKVQALDLGADDYLTKPFSVSELLARVRAALRRVQRNASREAAEQPVLRFQDVSIDLGRHIVQKGDKEVSLTRTEYELLHFLAVNAGRVVTHRQVLQEVWGPEYGEEREYLRTFVKQLRRKVEDDAAHPRLILTQPGLGYRLANP
jgi:two-component system KDP operon response regulator KdpE